MNFFVSYHISSRIMIYTSFSNWLGLGFKTKRTPKKEKIHPKTIKTNQTARGIQTVNMDLHSIRHLRDLRDPTRHREPVSISLITYLPTYFVPTSPAIFAFCVFSFAAISRSLAKKKKNRKGTLGSKRDEG